MGFINLTELKNRNLKNKFQQIKSDFIKTFKTPFLNKENKRIIIHCSHHKAGTKWFGKILRKIAKEYGLNFQNCTQDRLRKDTDIFLEHHSIINTSSFPYYKGSHMIRDPRDMIISGYFYHLWTEEEWVHIPRDKYKNMSYQQYLNSLNQDEGILAEIERFSSYDFNYMINWNYNDPNFLELKYENVINNEEQIFYEIFKHYEFNQTAIDASIKIAKNFSFKNVAKRNLGDIKNKSHLRSGLSGEWKELFNEQHKIYCKNLLGDGLIKLGYEFDYSW